MEHTMRPQQEQKKYGALEIEIALLGVCPAKNDGFLPKSFAQIIDEVWKTGCSSATIQKCRM